MNRKERFRAITEQNPFAHLGDAVYEILGLPDPAHANGR